MTNIDDVAVFVQKNCLSKANIEAIQMYLNKHRQFQIC